MLSSKQFIVASVMLLVGCIDSTVQPDLSSAPSIEVLYDNQPLMDVQIQLREKVDGVVLIRAVTGVDGKARFDELPSPEPVQYVVTAESFSDGSWMLDPKLSQPQTSLLVAMSIATNENQKIHLPPSAVRMLNPQPRR